MYADRHLFDGCAAGHLAENRKEQKQENQIIYREGFTPLRAGGVAVGAATLISLNLPEVARAGSESAKVFHVFAFQWKQGTSETQKGRA
jgi:hypothetical protein